MMMTDDVLPVNPGDTGDNDDDDVKPIFKKPAGPPVTLLSSPFVLSVVPLFKLVPLSFRNMILVLLSGRIPWLPRWFMVPLIVTLWNSLK